MATEKSKKKSVTKGKNGGAQPGERRTKGGATSNGKELPAPILGGLSAVSTDNSDPEDS